jgi:NTE family protein
MGESRRKDNVAPPERDLIRPFGAPSPEGKGEVEQRAQFSEVKGGARLHPSHPERVRRSRGRGPLATSSLSKPLQDLMANHVAMHYIAAMQNPASTSTEKQILVLQGGGALGAYQAGAYEALVTSGIEPEWLAGISIGAINGALIAGNPKEKRVAALREFWNKLSSGLQGPSFVPGQEGRTLFNEVSSWTATMFGIPGFFSPRLMSPLFAWPSSLGSTSFYDTAPLRETLNTLIDFDYLKKGPMRLTVGAVNVKTGNFKYFDTTTDELRAEHIMASGALPPGFPAVLIGDDYYWDGGLVSNTPLNQVIDTSAPTDNLCIYQVDLFSSEGILPTTIMEAAEREKEIRYSSRTRAMTKAAMADMALKKSVQSLIKKLPAEWRQDADVKTLLEKARDGGITVMHVINRPTAYDTHAKDYEFSRLSMEEHWQRGHDAVTRSLKSKAWKARQIPADGMVTFDHGKVIKNATV